MASNAMPTNKVMAGLAAGALTTIMVWATKSFGQVDVPVEVQGSITVLITFAVQYMIPDSRASVDGEESK